MRLGAHFDEAENQLLGLARRLYALEAFLSELERATQEKPFHMWNDVLWLMILDTRDMLVIHLASWAKSVYGRSGLLGRLQAESPRAFPRKRPWKDQHEGADAHLTRLHDDSHAEAFNRLFACASEPYPTRAAFDALRDKFAARMAAIVSDRSSNRAHPYEKSKGGANVRMLDLAEVRSATHYAEALMNDLKLVSSGCTLYYCNTNAADCSEVAIELVDSLLLGMLSRQKLLRGEVARDTFYGDMHARHNRLVDGATVYFNDCWESLVG